MEALGFTFRGLGFVSRFFSGHETCLNKLLGFVMALGLMILD